MKQTPGQQDNSKVSRSPLVKISKTTALQSISPVNNRSHLGNNPFKSEINPHKPDKSHGKYGEILRDLVIAPVERVAQEEGPNDNLGEATSPLIHSHSRKFDLAKRIKEQSKIADSPVGTHPTTGVSKGDTANIEVKSKQVAIQDRIKKRGELEKSDEDEPARDAKNKPELVEVNERREDEFRGLKDMRSDDENEENGYYFSKPIEEEKNIFEPAMKQLNLNNRTPTEEEFMRSNTYKQQKKKNISKILLSDNQSMMRLEPQMQQQALQEQKFFVKEGNTYVSIGGWRVDKSIGRGCFGEVFKVYNRDQRDVPFVSLRLMP